MIKHLLIALMLFSQCESILSEDPQTYLEPEHITGEWVRVTEVPSDVQGLYRKDTMVYQIGLDKLIDYIKFVDKNIYNPLTFKVIYPRGGAQYGYLEQSDDDFRDFDYDREESILNYKLYLGLPELLTLNKVSFSVPKGSPADTLRITVGREVFGLKKQKRLVE